MRYAVFLCSLVSVTIAPRAGNVLGGTAVQLAGPCLEETDNITCVFDGQEVGGVFVNTLIAVCVSPPLSRLGNVPFQLIVRSSSGDVRTKGTGEFFSCECMLPYTLKFRSGLLLVYIHENKKRKNVSATGQRTRHTTYSRKLS